MTKNNRPKITHDDVEHTVREAHSELSCEMDNTKALRDLVALEDRESQEIGHHQIMQALLKSRSNDGLRAELEKQFPDVGPAVIEDLVDELIGTSVRFAQLAEELMREVVSCATHRVGCLDGKLCRLDEEARVAQPPPVAANEEPAPAVDASTIH